MLSVGPSVARSVQVRALTAQRRSMLVLALTGILLAACSSRQGGGKPDTTGTAPLTSTSRPPEAPAVTAAGPPTSTEGNGPAGGPVPAGFRPTDATFINRTDGWAIGAAPCAAGSCTTIVRTRDGGRSWAAVPAPPADLTGLRFSSASVGYAFRSSADARSPASSLHSTADGGATWRPIGDRDLRISALEPGSAGVFAYGAQPRGLLQVTPTAVTALPGADQLPSGASSLAVHGRFAYVAIGPVFQAASPPAALLAYDGSTVSRRRLPCTSAELSGLALATSGDEDLALVCGGEPSAGSQKKEAWTSANGGRTWDRAGDPPSSGYVDSIAAVASGTFVTGSRSPVRVTRDGGRSWPVAYNGADGNQSGDAGYRAVGFADAEHGFAVPAGGPDTPEIDLTSDGGRTWTPSRFEG